MVADFASFILEVFYMIVKLFRNTNLGGISYEVLIVSVFMLSIVLTSIVVRFRPSFRPPRPERNPGSKEQPK